jgi:hypothetical protein
MEVTVLVTAITTYVRAGEDNDEGALAGSRADERQKTAQPAVAGLGWNFAMATAFTGLTVAAAVKAAWWWPFLVILAVTGFAYLLGLSNYGVAEEGIADDAGPRHPVRSAAS